MDAPSDQLRLEELGWSTARRRAFAPHAADGYVPGRVIDAGGLTVARTESGLCEVVVQRRAAREADPVTDLPAIGDWLALEPVPGQPPRATLRAVLPRSSALVRSRVADGTAQVLAANVDLAFLVSGLDHDLNVRRIERYLVLAMDAGSTPIVVLNKVDIALDLSRAVAEVHAVAAGTRVLVTSALTSEGVDEMRALLEPGLTACLLGSSGVGKSSLTNRLLGEDRQAIRELRSDDSKGRHTTTRRELFVLPGGGLVIDTPGLRTVGLTEEAGGIGAAFDEIGSLGRDCRFSDCSHTNEPGCAVLAAVDAGTLSGERYRSFQRLEAERRSVELRSDERARRQAERQLGRCYRRAGRIVARHKRGEE